MNKQLDNFMMPNGNRIYKQTVFLLSYIAVVLCETEILLTKPDSESWLWTDYGNKDSGNFIAGWNPPSPVKKRYSVCDVAAKIKPVNWLRSDYIDVTAAKRLDIEVEYSLRCPTANCVTTFELFVYHADKKNPAPDPIHVSFDKVADLGPPSPPGGTAVPCVSNATLVTRTAGIYLAFLDSGACLTITKVTVSYHYCAPRGGVLVRFPRTAAPANNSRLVEQAGECTDVQSVNKTKLAAVCLSNGEWNVTDNIKCLCKAGYVLVNGSGNTQKCEECPPGSYKSITDNFKCHHCPNQSTPNLDRTSCNCDDGFYKQEDVIKECEGGCVSNPLGLASGAIPDSDITSSTALDSGSFASKARLSDNSSWTPNTTDKMPWIQVNLQNRKNVTGVATQGWQSSYVKQYYVSYSDDGNNWRNHTVQGKVKVFHGNKDGSSPEIVALSPSVVAQYIRVYPTQCIMKCALRMELYGCNIAAGLPGQPTRLFVYSISTHEILISWKAPTDSGSGTITSYSIQWKVVGQSSHQEKVVSDRNTGLVVVPYTLYSIQVKAFNSQGGGPWSTPLNVRSAESVPSAAPGNLKLSSSSSLSLDLSWQAIPVAQQHGNLLGYRIYYKKDGSGMEERKDVGPNTLTYKLTGLEYVAYAVRILGYTATGSGKVSSYERLKPMEGVPSVAPGNLKLSTSSSLSLDVSWQAIPVGKQHGKLLGYRIYYKKDGSGREVRKDVGPNMLTYKLTGLEYVAYAVRVLGYIAIGAGPVSSYEKVKPMEGAPSPPRNLQLVVLSSTSIKTTWLEPEKKNGIIRRYVVMYGTARDNLNELKSTGSSVRDCELTRLEEFTVYFVQVIAETSVSGNSSATEEAKTFGDAPGSAPAIDKSETKAEDAHTIRVKWREISPQHQNGVILGYKVFYNVDGQGNQLSKTIGNDQQNTVSITGLAPYTRYCIKVSGFTIAGSSPSGSCFYVRTSEAGPSAPIKFRGQAVSARDVLLSWDTPLEPNGIIRYYYIRTYISQTGQQVNNLVNKSSGVQQANGWSHLISNLKPFTHYTFTVQAVTIAPGEIANCTERTRKGDFQTVPAPAETATNFVTKFLRIPSGLVGTRHASGIEDIVVVMDGSGSINHCEFKKGRKALKNMMDTVTTDAKYAAVTFGNSASVNFKFLTNPPAGSRILKIPYPGGGTNTQAGLAEAMKLFMDRSSGSRRQSREIVLLVTDGKSNNHHLTIRKANSLKKIGVEIFVVAVGSKIDGIDEMVNVASSPPEDHLFRVKTLTGLFEVIKLVLKQVAPNKYRIVDGQFHGPRCS